MKKLSTFILSLLLTLLLAQFTLANCSDEGWQFATRATGKTTGHIGDLLITNPNNIKNTIQLTSYIIPPLNNKQGYAIYQKQIKKVEIAAGETYTHKLIGYCINVNKPPVENNSAFPPFLSWLSEEDLDQKKIEALKNTGEVLKAYDFDKELEKVAHVILEAVNKLEEQYSTWKNPLQFPDLYPGNAIAVKEAIIQQALWQFTSALQGKTYNFKNFEQSILKQDTVKNWLSLSGSKSIIVDDVSLNNKTYFNYQCQKLWSIINEFNFYVNPSSRKVIPNWKSNTGKLRNKNIEFQELWENVALTGYHFKVEEQEEPKVVPKPEEETSKNKKALPFILGGVGVAGITVAAILLTGGDEEIEGCTNKAACNYNEKATTDDGSCNLLPAKPINLACYEEAIENINSCRWDVTGEQPAQPYDSTCNQFLKFDETNCDWIIDTEKISIDDNCSLTDDSFDFGNCSIVNEYNCPPNTIFNASQCTCDDIIKFGCTDPCAPNFNPNANTDNGNCEAYSKACNDDCSLGPIGGVWDSSRCSCINLTIPIEGCTDENACNYNPIANCDDGSCSIDPCDPNCLKEGLITFDDCASSDEYYLIEYGEQLFDPFFPGDIPQPNCRFYGHKEQKVLFNFEYLSEFEVDSIDKSWESMGWGIYFECKDVATPIRLLCLEPIIVECKDSIVEVKQLDCGNRTSRSFIGILGSDTLEFYYTSCFFEPISEGDFVRLSYENANFDPVCDQAGKAVIVTCLEKASHRKSNPDQYVLQNLSPFIENRILTVPAQSIEHPETPIITTVLGINYYKPITPTIFLQNQTIVGSVHLPGLYFLNNKSTINAKNPYYPIYYGVGLNNQLLTDFISSGNWETDIIWNVGATIPIFKKLQLEAEVFKTFNIDDAPNYSIRLIYRQPGTEKKENKKLPGLKF